MALMPGETIQARSAEGGAVPASQITRARVRRGRSAVFLAGALWGCMGLFVRPLDGSGMTSWDIVFLRASLTALTMLALILGTDRKLLRVRARDLWCFLGTGLLSIVFFNLCYFTTITVTSLSVAAILLYTAPAWVMLLSAVCFRERLTGRKLCALALALGGLLLVTGVFHDADRLTLKTVLVGLGAGLGYALYSIFGRYAIERGYESLTISFYTFFFATIATACFGHPGRVAAYVTESLPNADAIVLLGGGIGTRGPGESKLEMDRRLIHERIGQLKSSLASVVSHRELTRSSRKKSNIPVVAIVGYTNAGKSTLLNALTGADVFTEDALFATLDPTTRGLVLESGQEVLLTDTVGFISKLPHNLIDAFKSTLEEAIYADIILHVVDAFNPEADFQMHIVYETLDSLGLGDVPIITAFNKFDKQASDLSGTGASEDSSQEAAGDSSQEAAGDSSPAPINPVCKDFRADRTVNISARTGMGLDELKDVIEEVLRQSKIYIDKVFGYDKAGLISLIRKQGQLLSEEYTPEGIAVKAYVPIEIYGKL